VSRNVVLARLMSPFVIGCVDAFRDAYARTGMNLLQSIAVVAVGGVRWGGRKLGDRFTR
jgi:hypothetical protein